MNLIEELKINNEKIPRREIGEGFTLKDRFVLETKIGTGGMGNVYKSRDKRKEEAGIKNPFIAIKIINDEYKAHPQAFQTLQMEAAKAQALAHPNIVRIYDFDRDGDLAFITMEYLEGQTLKQMLATGALQNLSTPQKMALISEISTALIYMHQQGYAHADLKPSNIFITTKLQVKLIDFGFSNAAITPQTAPDTDSILTYSPLYASYEILSGNPATQADDVYALACVCYELFMSHHPYQKKNAQQAHEADLQLTPINMLNKSQWRALKKGLAIKRAQRYGSVEQFINEFTGSQRNWLQRIWG